MISSYPQEVIDFVEKWAPRLRDPDLVEICNKYFGTEFTVRKMRALRKNHGIKNGLPNHYEGEDYWRHQTKWPKGMYEYIRDNSWGVPSKEMAETVNRKFGTNFTADGMKQFRQRHGIRSGLKGWYQKGHPPGNKGKKLEEYVTDPARVEKIRARIAPTQFKTGERPVNEVPVGTIVTNSAGYKLRKRQMEGAMWERWEFLHQAVWKEHNGPIPEGMRVIFKDKNRQNCDISNLMLVSKEEIAAMTSLGFRSEDPELTEAGYLTVRLRNKIREKKGPKNPLGPLLMAKREQMGLTRRQVREEIGCSAQTVIRIEKGESRTTAKSMQAYLALMGVKTDEEREEVKKAWY